MPKKITTTLFTLSLMWLLISPLLGFAQIKDFTDQAAEQAGFSTDDELAQTGVAKVVGSVAQVFISLLGVIFISYTLYGGWLWLSAAGNEEKVGQAKKTIRDGIIGLLIVLAAAGIYYFIKEGLGLLQTSGSRRSSAGG